MLFEEKHSGSNYFCLLHYEDFKCIRHCQKSFEMVFVEKGALTAEINGQTYTIPEGSCATALPFQVHSYGTPENSVISIAIFSADFIPDFYEQTHGYALLDPITGFTPEELALLQDPADHYAVKAVLYRHCSLLSRSGLVPSHRPADAALISRIMSIIQEQYKSDLSLRTLAAELGYSYNYLSSCFRRHFGVGFPEYVNMFRLEETARLIRDTRLPLTEIALQSGFSTIRNFNMTFRRRWGMTPSEYRQREAPAAP